MEEIKSAIEKCADEELKKLLKRLINYQRFFLLDKGDITSYISVFETIGKMPFQLKEWLKVFDGGYLFGTTMFYSNVKKGEERKVLTYKEINSKEFRESNQIPEDVYCFAMTNYGNYYCFASDEDIDVIYEWDSQRCGFIVKWDNFAEWLKELIVTAISDIEAGFLQPMGE